MLEVDQEFAKQMEKSSKLKINQVQVDGLVLLKIMNHCFEKSPSVSTTVTTGTLLGLNIESTLEVTNCFPVPTGSSEQNDNNDSSNAGDYDNFDEKDKKYQVEMMRCLRDVNVDYTHVGWYQCSVMESYVNITTIDTQYSYQVEFGRRCICLVFDPLRTQRGKIALKAIRLSDKFMKLARELLTKKDSDAVSVQDTVITQELLSKMNITSEDMFEELPIKIHNLSLVESLLFDVEEQCDLEASQFDCFDLSTNPHLERVVEGMIECLDDLTSEYNKYQYYQRKMAQQKLMMQKKKDKTQEEEEIALKAMAQQQPNRLESLLIAHQVHNYCQQVNQFTGASLEKLYVAEFALKQQSK